MRNYDPVDASNYLYNTHGLRRSPKTLANLRSKGGGPAYIRISPKEILYPEAALNEWAESKIGKTFVNTAQEVAA